MEYPIFVFLRVGYEVHQARKGALLIQELGRGFVFTNVEQDYCYEE
jgi:hypothetical protein